MPRRRTQFRLARPGGSLGPVIVAAAVAAVAFALYERTLLPGQDLGDSASFQAAIGDQLLSPRQGYPLYHAFGNLVFWFMPGNPARALNLASAVAAAVSCGLLAWVAVTLAGSLAAGAFAGLLFATSYTFWSQAVTAEVYALHAAALAASLLAALRWAERPTMGRLAAFFFLFAAGFGNHLSMALLLPGFMLFLLWAARGGPAGMLKPRVLLLALVMAAAGASQYVGTLRFLLHEPGIGEGVRELAAAFWFDVTKADWRASMVLGTYPGTSEIRLGIYWFDLTQQFGVAGVLLAVAGLAALAWRRPAVAVLLATLFLTNWGFAFTYNVGDRHVFYLPSHFLAALFAGCGAAELASLAGRAVQRLRRARGDAEARPGSSGTRKAIAVPVVASLLLLYPAWRGIDTLPVLDRSEDRGAEEFFERLTAGLDGRHDLLGAELNWQLQNGLDYFVKRTRPDLVAFHANEVLLHLPFVVRDNRQFGRETALTAGAAGPIEAAYDGLLPIAPDPRVSVPSLAARLAGLPAGTWYVLTALAPHDDMPIDQGQLSEAFARLTGGRASLAGSRLFEAVAGRVGEPPTFQRADDRPFRVALRQGAARVEIRMEAWLPGDTIRRMGFGAVLVNRRHALTIDRGVSVVAFVQDGRVLAREYLSALLAPQPRFVIGRQAPGKSQ